MAEKVLIDGNEAIARGAIAAGCRHFFGYPITPQNEITEFMSREMPKIGGVYVQTESESSSVYMVYGGAWTGKRVMTSTSSPGFSLMMEGVSYIAEAEMPAVIVDVMRMGPGIGTGGQQGQTDYRQLAKGGGHGAYRNIVIAACSAQECYDFMQQAFYWADKYRMLVLVISDFIIGRSAEAVELRTLEFPNDLPDKPWAMMGRGKKGGIRSFYASAAIAQGGRPPDYHKRITAHYEQVAKDVLRWESYRTDDCDLLLASWGSSFRLCKKAVDVARTQGLKWGAFRPITIWPFPEEQLREVGLKAGRVVTVEDSSGELVEDVRCAMQGKVPVKLVPVWARHTPPGVMAGGSGLLYPEVIFEEVRKMEW